ncbi:WD40-repeat-containing domain protein, partial [Epithele typhae]|uniref:WD40-repeat-containing domain protein n=1 Tax=Epithele typhae TaxID=378194 RepID=UPI002008380D
RIVSGHGGGYIIVWDIATNTTCHFRSHFRDSRVHKLELSPDGRWFLSASFVKSLIVSDPRTGICIHTLTGHRDYVHTAQWSPCGNLIASSSMDGSVRIWRARDGACVGHHFFPEGSPSHLAFTGDGEALVLGRKNGTL